MKPEEVELVDDETAEFDTPHVKGQTKDYWKEVRERAAIAAMQGTISMLSNSTKIPNEIAQFAVACADSLIEELKKETN